MKNIYFTVAISILYSNVYAYDSSDDSNVSKERSSVDYAQKGIRAGSFTILPFYSTAEEYNSNVFYKDPNAGKVSDDFVTHFKPGVDVKSNWSRHALNLSFDTDITAYSKIGAQANYHDLKTQVDGRLDFTRSSFLTGGFAYNSVHESRGSVDQTAGIGPTFLTTKLIDTFYNQKFNRVSLKTGLDTIRYDYDNVLTSTGLVLQMQTRNHWEYVPSMRLGYEIQPEYEAFVKFSSKQVDYDSLVLSNGAGTAYNRSSSGYNALGGLAFDLTGLLTGDISVGYLDRNYQDIRLPSISGINGFVNLKWRPTALSTITGKFSHDINETTQLGVAGVMASAIDLGVEHELKRNILLKMGGTYSTLDYQGFDTSTSITQNQQNRVDNLYGGNIGAKYLFNRYLNTDLTYTYQNRDTNYLNNNYNVNQVMLNLRGQF